MRKTVRSESSSTAAGLVRRARARRGLSQRDLARAADVPQSTVANIESGRQQPSVMMLERLLSAAGFTLETNLANAVRPSVLLAQRHDDVARVLGRFPVVNAWVFGSAARGDDRPDSDLDLLVEIAPDAAFDAYVGIEDELAALLGCAVDVITTKELESNALLRRRVNRDLRRLDLVA